MMATQNKNPEGKIVTLDDLLQNLQVLQLDKSIAHLTNEGDKLIHIYSEDLITRNFNLAEFTQKVNSTIDRGLKQADCKRIFVLTIWPLMGSYKDDFYWKNLKDANEIIKKKIFNPSKNVYCIDVFKHFTKARNISYAKSYEWCKNYLDETGKPKYIPNAIYFKMLIPLEGCIKEWSTKGEQCFKKVYSIIYEKLASGKYDEKIEAGKLTYAELDDIRMEIVTPEELKNEEPATPAKGSVPILSDVVIEAGGSTTDGWISNVYRYTFVKQAFYSRVLSKDLRMRNSIYPSKPNDSEFACFDLHFRFCGIIQNEPRVTKAIIVKKLHKNIILGYDFMKTTKHMLGSGNEVIEWNPQDDKAVFAFRQMIASEVNDEKKLKAVEIIYQAALQRDEQKMNKTGHK